MGDLWTHCRASDQKENRLFVEGVNALPVVLDAQSSFLERIPMHVLALLICKAKLREGQAVQPVPIPVLKGR